MKKVLVSFFGGPGCGKTTAAAELFGFFKRNGVDTEIVSEFAKDAVLEGNRKALSHQWYTTATQAYRIACAYDVMDIVITDSPILLGPIYDQANSVALFNLCLEEHKKYNNINIFIERNSSYEFSTAGRVHSLVESVTLDNRIRDLLEQNNIPYFYLSRFQSIFDLGESILREIENERSILN